jgi:prephenate dehydrogenase
VTIGLIGYGRFGAFVAPLLARRSRVVVYDVRRGGRGRLPARVTRETLAEAARQQVVLLAVPVSDLRRVLLRIRPHLRAGSLVVDACAVKGAPVRWMKQIVPRRVGILGTHPFFGPDSAESGLAGLTVVLCPVRIEGIQLAKLLTELHRRGVETLFMSPDDHDRLMAETILLSQYVGRMVDRTGATFWPPVTRNYSHLRSIVDTVRRDTPRLFADMVRYNPHGKKLLREIAKAHRSLVRDIRRRGEG